MRRWRVHPHADAGRTQIGRGTVNRLLVVSALRSERAALAGALPNATLVRTGMGRERVNRWLPALKSFDASAIVVAGVAGALDPALRPGDVVVASEVRDQQGWSALRAAGPLMAALRSAGIRVHQGPVMSCDHVVGSPAERSRFAATGAIAVDMESAPLVRAAGSTPVAVVRVIVDTDYQRLTNPMTVVAGTRALWRLRSLAPSLQAWADVVGPRTVLLAGPRSFCAGVERAIDVVESALQHFPRPLYVRRQIVHNSRVVADLQALGAVFVDELDEVPDEATVVFSAHGVAPAVRRQAE
jgi:4-hydroxy-3-methylbut-2-enyl diphosphate reductase